MATKIYWLHTFDCLAKLGIMARPRGGDWLDDEITNIKKQHVGLLVSLLDKEEIYELELQQQETICNANGIEYINFPITDRDIPKTNTPTDSLINYLIMKLTSGISVVIHCRMGIGRSSIVAACILLHTGQKVDTIINNISRVRGLKVPDTDKQLQWLEERQFYKHPSSDQPDK